MIRPFLLSKAIIRITISLIAILIFNVSENSYAQNFKNDLNNFLTEYRSNKNIPSISGGVSLNGKIAWLGAVGLADIENEVPAKNNTLYRIASISKAVTAVAIMQLVEQNKIKFG